MDTVISIASDQADARCRMLNVAGPIFALRGYHQATVREICAAAEVNIASVGYYFGDKMGLYRAVVRQIRDEKSKRFPIPDTSKYPDPSHWLLEFVRTLLQRMLADGSSEGWQVRLMIREIQQPTEAMKDIVRDHFSPVLNQLCKTLAHLVDGPIDATRLKHLGLSVIGQCVHYCVSKHAIEELLADGDSARPAYGLDEMAIHIASVSLAAASNGRFLEHVDRFQAIVADSQFND